MLCFILETSECFRWVSLTYNHSVVATVCWNAVTSVKNISSCGPQKSTLIVSFLWSTVRCLLRTDHNKKVKTPVSHAPISKETVFRKIHFILAYAETINKRFSNGVIYLLCCICTPLVFCIVKSFSQIDYTPKTSYVLFLLQYCKATTTVNQCIGL